MSGFVETEELERLLHPGGKPPDVTEGVRAVGGAAGKVCTGDVQGGEFGESENDALKEVSRLPKETPGLAALGYVKVAQLFELDQRLKRVFNILDIVKSEGEKAWSVEQPTEPLHALIMEGR